MVKKRNTIAGEAQRAYLGMLAKKIAYRLGSASKDHAGMDIKDFISALKEKKDYDELGAYLYGPESAGMEPFNGKTNGPEHSSLIGSRDAGEYVGVINPDNEYVFPESFRPVIEAAANAGSNFYVNEDLMPYVGERYRYDAANHPVRVTRGDDGNYYGNAADIYDFDPGYLKRYSAPWWQVLPMSAVGEPYIVRQDGIPIRFIGDDASDEDKARANKTMEAVGSAETPHKRKSRNELPGQAVVDLRSSEDIAIDNIMGRAGVPSIEPSVLMSDYPVYYACGGKKYDGGGKFFRTNLQNESPLMYQPMIPSVPNVPVPVRYEPEPNLGAYEYPKSVGMLENYPITLPKRVSVSDVAVDNYVEPVIPEAASALDLFSDDAMERRALKQRYAESGFRDKAVSKAGAQGAWQIMPITYKDYLGRGRGKAGDLNDPEYNRKVRDWVMGIIPRDLQEFWSEDDSQRSKLAKLYAAYNWGAGNLRSFLRKKQKAGVDISNPDNWVNDLNPETRRYVKYLAFDEDIPDTVYTNDAFEKAVVKNGIKADGGNLFKGGGGKTKVSKGDSWIKIANDNGLSLADLLYWNGIDPTGKERLPAIHSGQEIYTSNPYALNASRVSADAPVDYADYGELGRNLVTNYARAIDQGAISLNDVPDVYKPAVYQRGITLKTDKAADTIFKTGLNTALFLSNPIGYTSGYAAQKGAAYANDALSGRNEYGLDDLIGYTPVMGTEYAAEHPAQSLGVDVLTGAIGGAGIRNIGNIVSNARQAFQNAAATTGLERQTLSFPQFASSRPSFGSVFQSGVKGAGKTGSQYAGRGASGYRPIVSAKGTFSHSASGAPGSVEVVGYNTPEGRLPISPIPFSGAVPLVLWRKKEPRVGVKQSEPKHIREEQTFSSWQGDNPGGVMADYVPGSGLVSIKGNAPIGDSIGAQALTNETLMITPGEYVPRKAVYVPGGISGTPSDIYSGLGIIYGSDNPGSLIFGTPHKDGGKIHIAPSKRGTFTAAAKKHGKSVQAFASQVLAHKENYSPAMVKKANFARNAAKWHAEGGILERYSPDAIRTAIEKARKK